MDDPVVILAEVLNRQGWTVAVAESCTGGMIGAALTSLPGSSRFFVGGIIAYSNEVKSRLLKVSLNLLSEFGAVSSQVAEAMAQGARSSLQADCAIAVTGIAGPDGGSAEKPVGLVYVSVWTPQRHLSKECRFSGSRESIRAQTVREGLSLALQAIGG